MRYRSHNIGNQGAQTAVYIASIPEETTILDLGCCNFSEKGCPGSPPDLAKVFAAIPEGVRELILIHNFSLKGRRIPNYGSETRSLQEWAEALSAIPKTVKKLVLHFEDINHWSKDERRLIGRALPVGIELYVVDDTNEPVDHFLVEEIRRHIGALLKETHAHLLFKSIPLPRELVAIIHNYATPVCLEEIETVHASGSFKLKLTAACVFLAPLITVIALSGQVVEPPTLEFATSC